jgi:hypothetical protein
MTKSRNVTVTVDLFVLSENDAQAAAIVKEALSMFRVRFSNPHREDTGVTGVMLRGIDVKPTQ